MKNNWELTQLLDAYGVAAVQDARIDESEEFREAAKTTERDARKALRKFCQDTQGEDPFAKFTKIEMAKVIAELTDDSHEFDIHEATGLPLERCREIHEMGNLFSNIFWG